MKKIYLLCIFVLQFTFVQYSWADDAHKVIILHTNDVHTFMDTGVTYAGVAAYKRQMQEKYGLGDVLMVDAGDAIQGGPFGVLTLGAALVQVMNAVGYDYMTMGNHEFDYGVPRLMELLQRLKAKVISCNISYIKDGSLLFAPYAIREFHGVKVAFLGITTPESLSKSTPAFFQDAEGNYLYNFAEGVDGDKGRALYGAVQKAVDAAKAEGAEVIIAVAHLGLDMESSPWTTPEVIKNTTGIAAVIDGHSHTVVRDMKVKNKAGQDVIVIQTGTRLQYLGKLTLDTKTKMLTAELIGDIAEQDAKVLKVMQDLDKDLAVILSKIVARSEVPLTIYDTKGKSVVRFQETNVGNLVTDAFRAIVGTDVAVMNGGSMRADIDTGDISYEEIIDVLPFGGDVVALEVTGQQILDALEMGAHMYPAPSGGFLHVSGMSYAIDTRVPSSVKIDSKGNFVAVEGAYRVKNVKIGGKDLDVAKKYSIAGTDYILQQSGDGMTMFQGAKVLKDKFMVDNEVLMAFLTKNLGGVVGDAYKKPQGRIVKIQ